MYSKKCKILFIFLLFELVFGVPKNGWESNDEIKRFQEYLRINTAHPNINYGKCVEFLKQQANDLGLTAKVHYMDENNPVVVITWTGAEPHLKSIMLNSHMDVVPVQEEYWTHPPFEAEIDSEGRIYARGSQDSKSMGMQYLAAIRKLMAEGVKLKRTVHVTFVPEEEMGGFLGMKKFVAADAFHDLNVDFAIDEGAPAPGNVFEVSYAERAIWRMQLRINGVAGHGSILYPGTAGEKLRHVLDRIMDFRATQIEDGTPSATNKKGNTTAINLTEIKGGVGPNVLPAVIDVLFDIRVGPLVDHAELENTFGNMMRDIEGVEIQYSMKNPSSPITPVDGTNQYWVAFKEAMNEMNLQCVPVVLGATTDSRFLREIGIAAVGFAAAAHTEVLAHAHNENLKADVFLKGIDIYVGLLKKIANI